MIGERLYDLRKDKGLSQDQLGEILNINKHSISSYERDRSEPPDEIKISMAHFFHVSVDYLLGLTDDPGIYDNSERMLMLPFDFPRSEEAELRRFISYLMYKHKNDKK